MDTESLVKLLNNPWIELLLGGIWQVLVVYVTWRWNEREGKLIAMVVLAIFPVAALLVQNTSELSATLDRVRGLAEGAARSSEVESAFLRIGQSNPQGLRRAQEAYARTLQELDAIAKGREPIVNETDYLTVLGEELMATPD